MDQGKPNKNNCIKLYFQFSERSSFINRHFNRFERLFHKNEDHRKIQQYNDNYMYIRGRKTRWCRVQRFACCATVSQHQYIVI
jgi:hypothetical protein